MHDSMGPVTQRNQHLLSLTRHTKTPDGFSCQSFLLLARIHRCKIALFVNVAGIVQNFTLSTEAQAMIFRPRAVSYHAMQQVVQPVAAGGSGTSLVHFPINPYNSSN